MKKKTLVLGLVAILLLILPVIAMTSLRITEPALNTNEPISALEPKPMDKCFVDWWKAGMVDVSIFYEDGDTGNKLLSIDDARQLYANHEEVLAKIDEIEATERNVAWWETDTDVYVGIGNTDEVLPIDKAREKYKDNQIISDKLDRLEERPAMEFRDEMLAKYPGKTYSEIFAELKAVCDTYQPAAFHLNTGGSEIKL